MKAQYYYRYVLPYVIGAIAMVVIYGIHQTWFNMRASLASRVLLFLYSQGFLQLII
jgi:hypothetical protein